MQDTNTSIRTEAILSRSALRWPSHAAVIDTYGSYTYNQLEAAADRVATLLQHDGVSRGSIVGIAASQARDFLAALFGTLKVGCVAIPVAPNLSWSEQRRVVSETHVSWIISAPTNALLQAGSTVELYAHSSARSALRLSPVTPTPEFSIAESFPDAAVIRHTSGTTAKSKGVVLSHKAVCQRTHASQELIGVTHEDVVLLPLQLSYHFIASALSCLQAGATILDGAELIAPEILDFGSQHGATIVYASPMQYDLITRSDGGTTLPRLQRAISTSALLPKRIADAFFNRFSLRLTQVYGIIEVGLPLWNELESIDPTALGICKPPYECIVVGEEGLPVGRGEVGELAIRGPGLFSGYLLGHESGCPRTAARCLLAGEWFQTGDLVVQDELGVILYRGRKKSVINCGGNKVFPEEVEEVLLRIPEILSVRVVSEPHSLLGSTLVAEVVLNPRYANVTGSAAERWRSLCLSELSEYKVPREFRIVESLPTTGSGKIVRHSLS
jgi:long-chain acyl-CoA synthetase